LISIFRLLQFELNREEWATLEHVEQVLNSFYEATKMVSGKNYSTIGLGYFAITNLKEYLEERTGNDEIDKLKDLLLDQLMHYFENDFDQDELLKVNYLFDFIGVCVQYI
jgi:hypothetical protein